MDTWVYFLSDNKRLQAWVALAQLFADGALDKPALENIANDLKATQLDQQTLYVIYRYEVAPCFWQVQWLKVSRPTVGWYSPRQVMNKVGSHVRRLSLFKKQWIDIKWKLLGRFMPDYWQQLIEHLT